MYLDFTHNLLIRLFSSLTSLFGYYLECITLYLHYDNVIFKLNIRHVTIINNKKAFQYDTYRPLWWPPLDVFKYTRCLAVYLLGVYFPRGDLPGGVPSKGCTGVIPGMPTLLEGTCHLKGPWNQAYPPSHRGQTHRRHKPPLWKHYLPATLLVGADLYIINLHTSNQFTKIFNR